jgi:hypothetical protein
MTRDQPAHRAMNHGKFAGADMLGSVERHQQRHPRHRALRRQVARGPERSEGFLLETGYGKRRAQVRMRLGERWPQPDGLPEGGDGVVEPSHVP